jgi:hypothetical protein
LLKSTSWEPQKWIRKERKISPRKGFPKNGESRFTGTLVVVRHRMFLNNTIIINI